MTDSRFRIRMARAILSGTDFTVRRKQRGDDVVTLMDMWEPIDTAPKDGKALLYLAQIDDNGKIQHIYFNGRWFLVGWSSANGGSWEPTHWAYQE
jgi:hypothetical protein